MAEWFSQYWHLVIVLIIVCIVAAVIFFFAAKALSRHNREYRAQEKEIKRLLELKEKYRTLTSDTILNADDNELLEGVALSYQLVLQKQEDIEGSFEEMNDFKKDIYALDVFVQDGKSKEFFSENGDILRKRIVSALQKIGMENFSQRLSGIALMYDDNDETVSYSEREIEQLDVFISENDILSEIKLKGAQYIKNNYAEFVN